MRVTDNRQMWLGNGECVKPPTRHCKAFQPGPLRIDREDELNNGKFGPFLSLLPMLELLYVMKGFGVWRIIVWRMRGLGTHERF